jgi:hypothetical protein
MSTQNKIDSKTIDPRIRKELLMAGNRLKENKANRLGARRWLYASGLAVVVLVLRLFFPSFSGFAFPIICGIALLTLFINYIAKLKLPLNYLESAKAIEKKFPEVEGLLTTALEQKRTSEGFNFLQEKLIKDTLHFSMFQYWEDVGKELSIRYKTAYLAAMSLLIGIAALSFYTKDRDISIKAPGRPVFISSIEVTPGDTEIERGSAVVIAIRFRGNVARSATLVVRQDDGVVQNGRRIFSLPYRISRRRNRSLPIGSL